MKSLSLTWLVVVAVLAAAGGIARAQRTVVGSPHDLSVTGPGRIHALNEEQVCIFCHTPHHATGQRPLWNRHMPPTHYRIYESTTTDALIDQPSGPSKMCLSCHDGALALGLVASRPRNKPILMSRRRMPPGPSDLTQDLSDDHPIGFRYNRALAARDLQIKNPDVVTSLLPLGKHSEMHCTTCHDPHNNELGEFLRITDVRSAICLCCHRLHGWPLSSHARSTRPIRGRAVDPRERLPYSTVAENACTSCHKIHSAEGHERLLRFRREEDNCLNCHNGSVAKYNIDGEIHKPVAHRSFLFTGYHDPTENPLSMPPHVECEDCHNPHAVMPIGLRRVARQSTPSVGMVRKANRFVSGMTRAGIFIERARFEYEICFKCHGDRGIALERPTISRQILQANVRLKMQTVNPSYHPIIGPRNNPDVVSLIPPWRSGSVLRCTDCHNSDRAASGGPLGPHGSIYKFLLIANYDTKDLTPESPRAYALCYRCHDRSSILSDQSFPLHSQHIAQSRTPCSVCHDAHGVSRRQGNSQHNSNLMNFDVSVVQPATGGLGARIEFVDEGLRRGNCTLKCHGVTHVRFSYGD
jgi:predicted CXXCH cytochrome family protein